MPSTLTDFASRSATTGRESCARASCHSPCPCAWPSRRTSSSSLTASSSATVWMPARRRRSAVAGPTPGITFTFIGRRRSSSVPGGTTVMPSGLSSSLATLARNFEDAMPTDRSEPARDLLHAPPQLGTRRGDGADLEVGQAGGREVDERLVQRQRLDERGEVAQHLHDLLAGRAVGVEAAAEERSVGAACPRLAPRHGGPHAVAAGLVGRGGHHAPAAGAADDDRLAAQRRLVALLDGGEEGVQVEVEDRRSAAHQPVAPGAGSSRHVAILPHRAWVPGEPRPPFVGHEPSTGATERRLSTGGHVCRAWEVGACGKRRGHGTPRLVPVPPSARPPRGPAVPPPCACAPRATSPPSCPSRWASCRSGRSSW